MSQSEHDGVMDVIAEEFANHKLPHLLGMKRTVERGEKLSSVDLVTLQEILDRAHEVLPIVERHPEYYELAAKAISLYAEISEKALENEQS